MKICAVSDTHNWKIRFPKCDVLAIAGDISMRGTLPWFIEEFVPYIQQFTFDKCLLVFGNHDDEIYMNEEWRDIKLPENIVVLNNTSYKYKNVKFYGSPNCNYIPGFLNTFSEETLEELFATMPDDTDVLITHSPAYGIGDTTYGDDYHLGSASLLEKIRQVKPKIHIFGHVHTGKKFIKENGTSFYNVSIVDENYEIAYKPTIVRV